MVIHDGHPYSMPPDDIGLPGTLYLYRDRIRIIARRFSADHARKFQPGDGSILPERTWIREVERLHELLQAHGDTALRTAFERGLAEQAIGAEYIAH